MARSDELQHVVLDLLLTDRSPGLWTTGEVARAIGDPDAAADAIAELHAFGLLHICDGHVCPSRAAVRSDQLAEGRPA